MSTQIDVSRSRTLAVSSETTGGALHILSVTAFGLGFTAALFYLLAHIQQPASEDSKPSPLEATLVTIAELPPPPPPQPKEPEPTSEPLPNDTLDWAYARSESTVKVEATPDLLEVDNAPAPPPTAYLKTNFGVIAAKPSILREDVDLKRVYDKTDVDQMPTPLQKDIPTPRRGLLTDLVEPKFRVYFVVDTRGAVSEVKVLISTGNPKLDTFMSDAIKKWSFTPALKKGKKVRCGILQTIYLKINSGSVFQ